MLPNFLIVGAAKSGTTSLYHYLNQHPEIYMSPVKEPHFFTFINKKPEFNGPFDQKTNEEIITNFDEYKKLFQGVTNEKAIGESSNSYLYFQETAANVKNIIPECKIIIILRNPIERAFSHYMQSVMIGHENVSFEEALKKENERLKLNWRWHYQYVGQGMYYSQIKRYIEIFGQRMIKIYLFEKFKDRPADLIRNIYRFLEVDDNFMPYKEKIHNPSGKPIIQWLHNFTIKNNRTKKNIKPLLPKYFREKIFNIIIDHNVKKVSMSEITRRYLATIFKDDIINLQQLTEMDFRKWMT